MTTDPDAELMMAFKSGNEQAFVTLYERYREKIVNFTRRFLGNQAQGEEAAQEVFLKLYQAGSRYQPTSRFSTYLYRIATNHCLHITQRHDTRMVDRHTELGEQSPSVLRDSSDSPEVAADESQLRASVSRALNGLADNQRAALLLCHYQGLSYREAADAIDVSESAIKSLIHRAKERLAKELKPLHVAREVG